jgi:hypothetical protein
MLRMFILARPTRAGNREGLPDLVEMTRVTGGARREPSALSRTGHEAGPPLFGDGEPDQRRRDHPRALPVAAHQSPLNQL